jgi:hypothetical protein
LGEKNNQKGFLVMHEDTKFILERMDYMRQELLEEFEKVRGELKTLEEFRQKVSGIAVVAGVIAGGIGSLAMQIVLKRF